MWPNKTKTMSITTNSVYIGTSLDGYIADQKGGLDWLESVPNPDGSDMGYYAFLERMDALLMGRTTYETVLNFGIEWPYTKPVYVLSNTLEKVPEQLVGKVWLVKGELADVLRGIHDRGHTRLYIDGGRTIQSFLREDLIDELILTTIPVLLGGGFPLFGELARPLMWELVESKVYLNQIVQRHYRRKRSDDDFRA